MISHHHKETLLVRCIFEVIKQDFACLKRVYAKLTYPG